MPGICRNILTINCPNCLWSVRAGRPTLHSINAHPSSDFASDIYYAMNTISKNARTLSDADSFDKADVPAEPAVDLQAPRSAKRDCDDLIDTVKCSLWGLIDAPIAVDAAVPPRDSAGRVRSTALQGALALGQLQKTLAREFLVRKQLEREIREAREALEQARSELAGTRAEEQRARYLALHDHLTALPNRSFFHQRLSHFLDQEVAPSHTLAVLFLDLDGFKPINDAHGHSAGDELLRIVAARLGRTLRTEDTVCRMGGDEFACMLAGLESRDQAAHLAAKLRDAIQAPCKIGNCIVSVGVSIGIALYPTHGDRAQDLLLKADLAMYRAKRQSIGVAFYDDTPNN